MRRDSRCARVMREMVSRLEMTVVAGSIGRDVKIGAVRRNGSHASAKARTLLPVRPGLCRSKSDKKHKRESGNSGQGLHGAISEIGYFHSTRPKGRSYGGLVR